MCLELCSRANWRQILVPCHGMPQPRNLELVMESSARWARATAKLWGRSRARNQARKQCCHLSRAPPTARNRQQGQGLDDAALEAAVSHCKAEPGSEGCLGLRTETWRAGDTKEGWWLLSKQGQHLFLQELPQTITMSVFSCVQLGWRKTKMGIPQRLGWAFLKTGGTLRLHWNYSVSKQPKLNGTMHSCSWQTALSKDTTKLSHRRAKTSVLMLST